MQPVRVMYEVSRRLPREKRARKSLVCRFVVLAATEAEAISRAQEESVLGVDGEWKAREVTGFVLQIRNQLEGGV